MYRHGQEEIDAATEVLRGDKWFRYGDRKGEPPRNAERFETEWAQKFGVPHACFTSSGTAALLCCYAGLQIGPGDEVIVPAYTWIASALAPLAVGAIPVLVDCDESLTIDPAAIERAITPRTKAICPVHMMGFASDMDRILALAQKHNLAVVEDACQCDGGVWKDGRRLGTLGDMGAYSFNYMKVLSCGDGGLFVTRDRVRYERGLIYHDGGAIFRPHAAEIGVGFFAGMNLRGNEILAAIMRVQLARLDGLIRDFHRIHVAISERVAAAGGPAPIPYRGSDATGTHHALAYRFPSEAATQMFYDALLADPERPEGGVMRPINSGRHVYANWIPVLQQRGSYHAKADPYQNPVNAASLRRYDADSFPQTLRVLKTTVIVKLNPDWLEAQVEGVAVAIVRAAEKISVAS